MRNKKGLSYTCFKGIKGIVKFFYPKIEMRGLEKLPQEPSIIVANHCQLNGPIIGELYFPENKTIWCAGPLVHFKEVPDFAYNDFFKFKPKYTKWFWRIVSYLMAPIFPFFFKNADTIPVYRDTRVVSTLKNTVKALEEGKNVVIFPESFEEGNNVMNKLNEGFVDIGKLYYKRTGKLLAFVPMYIAPTLKKTYIEEPIYFNPSQPIKEERERLCAYLTDKITQTARELPRHLVIPHDNIPRKLYSYNKEIETLNTEMIDNTNEIKEKYV